MSVMQVKRQVKRIRVDNAYKIQYMTRSSTVQYNTEQKFTGLVLSNIHILHCISPQTKQSSIRFIPPWFSLQYANKSNA